MIYTHAAAAIVAAALAAAGTWQVQNWRYGAKEADRLQLVAEQARHAARSADAAAAAHEADKATLRQRRQIITQEVDRVVEKPVYRDVCLDADGLRLITTAISATAPASQPAPALPATATAR